MKQRIELYYRTLVVLLSSIALLAVTSSPLQAIEVFGPCKDVSSSELCSDAGTDSFTGQDSILRNGLEIFVFIIGFASVVAILLGAFRYITSRGDPQATVSARNTIIYAVVGLIVALLAESILVFVVQTADGT